MSFGRNLCKKYGKHLIDTATKAGLDALKTTSKKEAQKPAKATREFMGTKSLIKLCNPKLNLMRIQEIPKK